MRICFFSDIHGNIAAFEAFRRDIRHKEADCYIFGGDVVGYYYHADEILDILRANDVKCLLGNHDKMFLDLLCGKVEEKELVERYGNSYKNILARIKTENIDFLKTFMPSYTMFIDGIRLGFFHGGPTDPLEQRIYPDTDLEDMEELDSFDYIFVGHTHHKMVRQAGKCQVINPGSVGQQRDGMGCSYVIFDTKNRKLSFYTFSYDRESLAEEIRQREDKEELRRRLTEVLYRETEIEGGSQDR